MRGKVGVVGCLLLAALSIGVLAGPLSGQWNAWGTFEYDVNEAVMLVSFESLLEIDYTTRGWTLTGSALFSKHEFEYLWFTASGSLGAIDLYSALTFGSPGLCGFVAVPTSTPLGIGAMNSNGDTLPTIGFLSWISSAWMSVGEIDLFGIFAVLKEHVAVVTNNHAVGFGPKDSNGCDSGTDVGAGLILGGRGTAGDCEICLQAGFNLSRQRPGLIGVAPLCVCHYGWDWVLPSFAPIHCCDRWTGPDCQWEVDSTCCLPFSWASIYLEQSFACFDLTVDVLFTCEDGFDSVYFTLCDVCLGLPWLELGVLRVGFAHEHNDGGGYQKNVWGGLDVVVADCVCITPYLALDWGTDGFFGLDGISLAALMVEYDIGQGVTFKAGHRFSHYGSWLDHYEGWFDWEDCQSVWFSAFTETGDVAMWTDDKYCRPCLMQWDEYIGFMIDGDSCCGGQFDAWIFTWFNTGKTTVLSALDINPMDSGPEPAFMDWTETRIKLAIDISTNAALLLKASLDGQGLNWLNIGVETRW